MPISIYELVLMVEKTAPILHSAHCTLIAIFCDFSLGDNSLSVVKGDKFSAIQAQA